MGFEVTEIDISLIDVSEDRARRLNVGFIPLLSASIEEVGLINPIGIKKVRDRYRLIHGLHRLNAFKHLKHTKIPAFVIAVDNTPATLMELQENIMRIPFTPLQMSRSLIAQKDIYEAMYPETKKGAKGIAAMMPTSHGWDFEDVPSFMTAAGDLLNLSRSHIYRYFAIRHICPAACELIDNSGHKLERSISELEKLSKLDDETQIRVTKLILSDKFERVCEARDHLKGGRAKPSVSDQRYSRIMSSWSVATPREKSVILDTLAEDKLPAGYMIIRPGDAS